MNFIRNLGKAPLFLMLLVTGIVFTVLAFVGRSYYARYDTNALEAPLFSVVFQGLHDKVYPWGEVQSEGEAAAQALLAQEEAEAEEVSEEPALEEPEEEKIDYELPASSTNEVVPAIDYGNTDANYLSPAGTVWEKNMDGIFATNGEYVELRSVDDAYFKDALFIGDSRTEGLYVYSTMHDLTTFDAKDSVTIFGIYDASLDFFGIDGTQGSKTAMEALQEKPYRKIYVSVGVNELGMPTMEYFNAYKNFIEVVRKLQPDAIIYVQGIMHVTGSYAQRNTVYNNTNIVDRNKALATLANGRDIFYLDMNSAICDADGNIPEDKSYDGVHLKASAYELWHEFLLQNAAVRTDEDWIPLPKEVPAVENTEESGEANTNDAGADAAGTENAEESGEDTNA